MKNIPQILLRKNSFSISAFLIAFLFLITLSASAQQNLDYNSKVSLTLKDGTTVILYAQTEGAGSGAKKSKNYYFLPTQAMLSKNPQTKVPEFLFLKYVNDEKEEQKAVDGAVLHFLMQLGYTDEQKAEIQSKLAALIPGAVVKGAVDLFPHSKAESFQIISAVVQRDGSMTKNVVTSGQAPLFEGGKVAVAANLKKEGAQLLAATFAENLSITDLTCDFYYNYYLRVSGLKAKIILNYTKMAEIIKHDRTLAKYHEDGKDVAESQSWEEVRYAFDQLIEQKAITIDIDEGLPTETSKKLIEILFTIFLNKFTTPANDKPVAAPPSPPEREALPGVKNAQQYYLDVRRIERSIELKTEVINMNYDYMLSMPISFSQNLKTWYNSVKDNANCVSSVYLNDPFYKKIDIRFMIDQEIEDIFKDEINSVTVTIRKKRNSGNDFTDYITFNKDYIKEHGATASISYAGGVDKNPEMYQYKVQWSFRRGIVFPLNPQWEQGQMQAVTLYPPVEVRTIEFEADLDKLTAADISRVTLQIRYRKCNEEYEQNMDISPVKKEPLVSRILFIDRDTRGYVYRLIFNHKTDGKLATPWSAKISDNYVYAMIPDGLLDKNSEAYKKAVESGQKSTIQNGAVKNEKILDGYKDIMGVKN